jgi:hypothetical protein
MSEAFEILNYKNDFFWINFLHINMACRPLNKLMKVKDES